MMRTRRTTGVLAWTVGLLAALAVPASAAAEPTVVECAVTNGSGDIVANGGAYVYGWITPSENLRIDPIVVADNHSDGYGVAIRFMTGDGQGSWHDYQWRYNTDGAGTVKDWITSAQDEENGIFNVGVQVKLFDENGTIQGSCSDRTY